MPVAGALNGAPFKTTIVRYQGAWRLYLNTQMRRDAAVDVGGIAEVALSFDPALREWPIPPALADALRDNRRAAAAWEALVPSRRKEMLAYLNSLKTEASVRRIVQKIIAQLTRC